MSKSISHVHCCDLWLGHLVYRTSVATWYSEGPSCCSSSLVLGCLSVWNSLPVLLIACLSLGLFLLQRNGQLTLRPAGSLGVPSGVYLYCWGVLCLRRASLCCAVLPHVQSCHPAVHHLSPKSHFILFPLLDEVWLTSVLLFYFLFALNRSNISFGGVTNIVLFVYLCSLLLEHPVVLIIVIVSTFVHKVFEDLAHVVIVWSLVKLQVPAVIEIDVDLLLQASCQRLDGSCNFFVFYSVVFVVFCFSLKSLPRQTAF